MENQTAALSVRLLNYSENSNPSFRAESVVKIRALIGKEWNPVTWDEDVWEDPPEAENFEPQNLKGLCHLRK